VTEGAERPAITIDRELCLGSGVCIVFAPATFGHDAETKAVVLDPAGDSLASIEAAVEGCPTGAIKLVDQEGG
jgi:ferredoxin